MSSIVGDSLKGAFKRPITWAAVVIVPLIVVVFGLLYATTFIDPTERMKEMPIALVNLDEGAQDADGEERNFGEELIESIQEGDEALWVVEDASVVDEGLENTDYYIAVVIPEDFSQLVLAGQTSDPETAELVFYKNNRKNYLVSLLASSVESALKSAVNSQIGEQYATALAEGLLDAGEGFADAAEGSADLEEGLSDAASGGEELAEGASALLEGATSLDDGLGELTDGAATLASGIDALAAGAASLEEGLDAVSSGAESLQRGLDDLASGSESLAEGLDELSSGLDALDGQSATLTSGSSSVAAGLGSLESGSESFEASVDAALSSAQESLGGASGDEAVAAAQAAYAEALSAYTTAVATAVATGQGASSVDASELTAAVSALAQASAASGVYEALAAVSSGYEAIGEGIAALDAQYAALDGGLSDYTAAVALLAAAASSASDGASDLAEGAGSAASGGASLVSGAASAAEGAASLSDGAASAQDGAASLVDGTESAASGAGELVAGADSLDEGAASLSEGLSDAASGASELTEALSDGVVTISDAISVDAETMGAYVAEPVDASDEVFGELEHFGYGLAPLFLTLSLWLGALMTFFIFDPFPSCEHLGDGRLRVLFGRWPLYLVLAALNAAALSIACAVVGLQCTSWPLLVLLFACMAFSFMCIMQFLNLFDVVGKALAVTLVIVQLVFCSGTFPAMLGSDIAEAVGPCLPFQYAIDAIREVMSGTDPTCAFADMGMLLLFAAGAVALSLLSYPLALRMKRSRDAETVRSITGRSLDEARAGGEARSADAPAGERAGAAGEA